MEGSSTKSDSMNLNPSIPRVPKDHLSFKAM